MADFPPRLGDLIDDHCPRCRLLLNHAIASMVKDQVVKVVCQTCYSEHAYQRGQGGKKKPHARATLFDQVLSKVSPGDAESESTDKTEEESSAPAGDAPGRKKKVPPPARYISGRKTRPPRAGP